MSSSEPPAGSGSPNCPDLLEHVQTLRSPATPVYLSFFEEECLAIAARLRLAAAAELSPDLEELSPLRPQLAGLTASTPLPIPRHGRVPDSSVGDCEAAATPAPSPGPAPREPECVPQPAAGRCPSARPSRPPAQSRRVRCGPGQPSGTPARSPGRGRARLALLRTGASLGLQLPAAGTGRGAWETRLLRPPGKRGHGGEPQHGHLPLGAAELSLSSRDQAEADVACQVQASTCQRGFAAGTAFQPSQTRPPGQRDKK